MTKQKTGPKREKQTRYLSQAIQLEESVNPHIIKATMTMVSLAIMVFLIWAGFTNINEVARTPGEVVPAGYQQTVQHLEGGIIKKIYITEGEIVDEGQVLISLNDDSIKEDLERAASKQFSLEKHAERLRAFLENRSLDFTKFPTASDSVIEDQKAFFEGMRNAREKEEEIIRHQISQKKQDVRSLNSDLETALKTLSIDEDMYQRRIKLNKKGYASDMQVLSDEKAVNQRRGDVKRTQNQILVAESEISGLEGRLESLSARHRDEINEKLDIVLTDAAQNAALIEKLKERISRLQIKAPARGLVQGLNVNTIGAVIQPGQVITEILPLDKKLEVAVKISPQDIGHLKKGLEAQIKISTFDFSRYGSVNGTLEHISATTFSGTNGERYYQGRVLLSKNYVGDNPENIIMPGMTVMADVVTGEKTILQYLLKPIHISLKTAFTER